MIAVIGVVAWDERDGEPLAAGMAVEIAAEAAALGREVQIVGKVGEDEAGNEAVVDLAKRRVGHAALLREAGMPTPLVARTTGDEESAPESGEAPREPDEESLVPAAESERPILDRADVELALRYLPGVTVVVATGGLTPDGLDAAIQGAAYAGAKLVVTVREGEFAAALPETAIALEAPERDDGSFVRFVAALAALLDEGADPERAFREALSLAGWHRVTG